MTAITPVTGPAAWRGSELDWREAGMRVLSADEVDEIAAALRHLHRLGEVDFPDITRESFPLPTLGQYLARVADLLRDGPGFLLLRGLPRERWQLDDLARVYYGIGVHIGQPAPQSWQGELLGHVIDVSDVERDARGYHKGGAQRMHTDNCDIVSLFGVKAAKAGGISRFVSVAAVHNRMLAERPDLVAALYGEYVFRRMEQDAAYGTGELVKRVVVFSRDSGQLTCNVSGSYPHRAARAGDWTMSEVQAEALEEMKRISMLPELALDMTIGDGDIQFLNNRTILHGRTGYEDWPQMARRRHLMRLWLQVPAWPPLPANQGVHAPADRPLWLRQRTPAMELPSRYLAAMAQRQATPAP